MRTSFLVADAPPKKDGANSMWRKWVEVPRLKALRQAAFNALGGKLIRADRVELVLRTRADVTAGDLDSLITGVCDGLMAAHLDTPIDDRGWSDVPAEIHPRNAIAFDDDSCVAAVHAERTPPTGQPQYEVELSG